MTRKVKAAALALAFVAGAGVGSLHHRAAPPVLQEDDPGWDCATMGNRVCGPVTLHEDNATWWVTDGKGKGVAGGWLKEVDHR